MYNEELIYSVKVQPTYAVLYPNYHASKYTIHSEFFEVKKVKTEAQINNEKNLKENSHRGYLSQKGARNLLNACNWLVLSAQDKIRFSTKSNSHFKFSVNFVTLTLPVKQGELTDNYIKNKCFAPFLSYCRVELGLKSYVWKCEAQKNGNLHIHMIADVYLDWEKIRNAWNRILDRVGLIKEYTEKFTPMLYTDYKKLIQSKSKMSDEQCLKAFRFGKSTNWTSPNTTDVHGLSKVKDIGAYIATYMSKKDSEKRAIVGKIWGCSEALSSKNAPSFNIYPNLQSNAFESLMDAVKEMREIKVIDKITGCSKVVARICFYSLDFLKSKIKNEFFELVNKYKYQVRNNLINELTI